MGLFMIGRLIYVGGVWARRNGTTSYMQLSRFTGTETNLKVKCNFQKSFQFLMGFGNLTSFLLINFDNFINDLL